MHSRFHGEKTMERNANLREIYGISDSLRIAVQTVGMLVLILTAPGGLAQSEKAITNSSTVPLNINIARDKSVALDPVCTSEKSKDWRGEALEVESIKKIADKVTATTDHRPLTYAEQLQVLSLRYDMAMEAVAQGKINFAALELSTVQGSLRASLKDSFVTGDMVTSRVKLLKEVLKARMAITKALYGNDQFTAESEIQGMQNVLDGLNQSDVQ